MAEGKKSFVAYCDWITTFNELSDQEAGVLIKHLLRYVNDQNPEPPDKLTQIAFAPIKATLKRDLEKYERKRTKNSENAKARWNASASERMQADANHADSVSDSVSVSVSVSVEEDKSSSQGRNPNFEEWKEYWDSEQKDTSHANCRNSFLYYQEKGWKDKNGNEVKNWKNKVRNTSWWSECPIKQVNIHDPAIIAKVPDAFIDFCKAKWGCDKKESIRRWKDPQDGPTYRKIHYYPDPNLIL